MTTLYWAYGSNLNHAHMRVRCPAARPAGRLVVPNAVLRFRGVADVDYLEGARCEGGLWEITRACEAALDRYEGVDAGLYEKCYLKIRWHDHSEREVLYYRMLRGGILPPDVDYLETIRRGYRDFGLSEARLERALAHAWRAKRPTKQLRQRWKRRGAKPLARC